MTSANNRATQRNKILIVDDDPEVRALLRDLVLNPSLFEVHEAEDGASGLQQVRAIAPDMILLDLVMPDLSGNDFLVALRQQGFSNPVLVMTKRGSEMSAIDAFRLGAVDFFTKPIREAEALNIIESRLKDVQLRRERTALVDEVRATNAQLQARIKELTTLSQVGRRVTTVFDLETLFDRILEAAIYMTEADHSALLLMDESTNRLMLRKGRALPLVLQEKVGEPVNDGLASLVMQSGEPFAAAGDGLKRFAITSGLNATIYAPLRIGEKSIGVLTVGNHKKRRAFDEQLMTVMGTLADYASIGITNARLFNALESRAKSSERAFEEMKAGLRARLQSLQAALDPKADAAQKNVAGLLVWVENAKR